jgi:hypothetical protein
MSLESDTELQSTSEDLSESVPVLADDGEDDGGFEAGYASTNGEVGNTELPDDEEAAPVEEEVKPEATPEPTPAPVVKIGRWTEDELAERFAELESLKKGTSTIAGHIGNIQQRLSGQGRKTLTPDDLKKVREEYGDEFAVALAEDLNAAGLGGATGPTQAEIDQIVSARMEQRTNELERKFEKRLVLRTHRDADEHFSSIGEDGSVVHGPKALEFRAWLATQPKDRQELVASSWDSDVMIAALSDFKASKTPPATPAPTPAPAAARTSRVARAVAPQGAGAATPPSEDPFEAGYKAAKGRG